jgi:hypothetical protein
MAPSRRFVVVTLLALALTTSGLWFFPNEGEPRYTYDRAEATVEDGKITYAGQESTYSEYNNLEAVGCQYHDSSGRRCAFDAYLVDHGPVNVSISRYQTYSRSIPAFVELSDGYYRRVGESVDEDVVAYDVEKIEASELLAGLGTKTAGGEDSQFISRRVAVSGAETSLSEPGDVSGLGEVYRVDGTYYVVVVSERGEVDNIPVPFSHSWAQIVGLVWLVGLGLVVLRERWADVRAWLASLRAGP